MSKTLGDIKGVGKKLLSQFNEAEIFTLRDLLFHLPRRYEDRRRPLTFEELEEKIGQAVISQGTVERFIPRFGAGRRWLEAVINVPTRMPTPAFIYFVWFHQYGNAMQKGYPAGCEIFFSGKIQKFQSRLQIAHPELSKESGEKLGFGQIVPIYPLVEGLTSRKLREIIREAMEDSLRELQDPVPADIQKEYGLVPVAQAIEELHHPTKWNPLENSQNPYFKRLVFDEFFFFALGLERLRKELEAEAKLLNVAKIQWKTPVTFPFELTSNQLKIIEEIKEDLAKNLPMHRLLQGDVGSGKTAVAFSALIQCVESGYQGAMLAPTQILATQHYETFCKFFPQYQDKATLLTGALKESVKKDKRKDLKAGITQFVFGTQALLTHLTEFDSLGLVVVDEQHRFGVEQRRELAKKSKTTPHLLVMTATPIPRSLALTLYGDLDISTLKEKPVGRKDVKTFLLRKKLQEKLADRLSGLLAEGRQIYLVYPLVEDSELLENVESVTEAFAHWKKHFAPLQVGLLHGRMKGAEKDKVMHAFRMGELRVLVSTTVIEVGVDIPNASVMVIENAERFGLSQLHQLRGRVGRGEAEGICALVVSDNATPEAEQRLHVIVESNDGFKIAEEDLLIRGPGNFLGVKQSGASQFKTAHLVRDLKTLEMAKAAAKKVFALDPKLEKPEHKILEKILTLTQESSERLRSG